MTCKGYGEANNEFWKTYSANKDTSYIIYLDANNMDNGHCMIWTLYDANFPN